MSGIAEFTDRTQFPEAVEASFTDDVAVVRGVIDPKYLDILNPYLGNQQRQKTLVMPRPFLGRVLRQAIPGIDEARRFTRGWMQSNLGCMAAFLANGNVIKADLFRNGGISTHVDNFIIVNATSVNLTNGDEPTIFYAERLTDATAPFSDITAAHSEWAKQKQKPSFVVPLDPGDIVVISRGVEHMVEAPVERQALMLGTRTIAV